MVQKIEVQKPLAFPKKGACGRLPIRKASALYGGEVRVKVESVPGRIELPLPSRRVSPGYVTHGRHVAGTRACREVVRNCENSAVLTYAHGATQQQSTAISPLSEHSLIGSRDVPLHTTPLSDVTLTRWAGGRH